MQAYLSIAGNVLQLPALFNETDLYDLHAIGIKVELRGLAENTS